MSHGHHSPFTLLTWRNSIECHTMVYALDSLRWLFMNFPELRVLCSKLIGLLGWRWVGKRLREKILWQWASATSSGTLRRITGGSLFMWGFCSTNMSRIGGWVGYSLKFPVLERVLLVLGSGVFLWRGLSWRE
jgi:hypothetical protein